MQERYESIQCIYGVQSALSSAVVISGRLCSQPSPSCKLCILAHFLSADFFFNSKNLGITGVSISFDPDQVQYVARPYLSANYLPKLSADGK